MVRVHRPLGQVLLEQGLLSAEDLERALRRQEQTGERLGRILLVMGLLTPQQLAEALAQTWGIEPRRKREAVNPRVLQQWGLEASLLYRAAPLHFEGGRLRVLVADGPSPELLLALRRCFGLVEPHFVAASEEELQGLLSFYFSQSLGHLATYTLYERSPIESAHTVFTRGQFLLLTVSLLALGAALYLLPLPTLAFLNLLAGLFFLTSVLFKFLVSLAGAKVERDEPVSAEEVRALKERDLPRYTILVPVYKEANVVGLLVRNLARLDYPKEKLEVLILVEEDDPETLQAIQEASPPPYMHIIVVPHSLPKTKPKACNVGLAFAQGEYLVIYDAEDEPEPDQLKKAVVAFRKGPPSLVCVQAALNYFNWKENFITRMFTLEYSFWFDYMLPGLQRLGLPIPLGGTSNHFKTAKLRELGGWDPFNVTEDADLGIRAAMRGYTVGVINSTTFEEANNHPRNFIRQRSRWIKGYLQTMLVHSRRLLYLLRRVGLRQFLGFALLIGGTPLTFLLGPILWGVFLLWLFTGSEALSPLFQGWVLHLSLFNLILGNGIAIYLMMLAAFKRRLYRLVPYALLNPLYWLLHSRAAYMALYQLFTRPFYWEKTLHGLSRHPLPKHDAA